MEIARHHIASILAPIENAEILLQNHPVPPADIATTVDDLERLLQTLKPIAEEWGSELTIRATCAIAQLQLSQVQYQPTSQAQSQATTNVNAIIQSLESTLQISYNNHSSINPEVRSKVRLLLALAYDLRMDGLRSENISRILEHTDSLDLSENSYLWFLSRILRGKAYRDRSRAEATPFDGLIALNFLNEAITGLEKQGLNTLLPEAYLEAGKTVLRMRQLQDGREPSRVAEQYLGKALSYLSAELQPFRYAEVCIGLGNVSVRRYAEQATESKEAKNALQYFERARQCVTGSAGLKLLAEADLGTAALYSHPGTFHSDEKSFAAWDSAIAALQGSTELEATLSNLSEYGILLFSRRLWSRAVDVLKAAISTAETVVDVATLLSSRREAVRPLSRLTMALAYCEMESGQFDQAFLTVERGRARLLSESLRINQRGSTTPNDTEPSTSSSLADEMRHMEAEQYGGMFNADDFEKLQRMRGTLHHPPQQRLGINEISDLAPSEPGKALVVSLLTEHGAALFILQHGESTITSENVIRVPDLSLQQMMRWLTEDGVFAKSWFGAYAANTEDMNGRRRWMMTIELVSKRLGDVFIKKLASRLKDLGIRSIVMIAGGGLQFLPLCACLIDDAGHCLLDEVSVTFAPSAYVAAVCAQRGHEGSIKGGRYFLAGVSTYEDASELPHVKAEVEVVGQLLNWPSILDDEVNREAFSNRAPGSSIVHLACHGTGWFATPMFRFSLAPGLVLRFTKDGLSFGDILRTHLNRTVLVTLSACDTGALDRTLSWDEFEGLPHVFLQSGVASVVSSIWAVNDRSTALLMLRFYSNLLLQEQTPAQALREAQLWLRDASRQCLCEYLELFAVAGGAHILDLYSDLILGGEPHDLPYNHPMYWAPFVVTGG